MDIRKIDWLTKEELVALEEVLPLLKEISRKVCLIRLLVDGKVQTFFFIQIKDDLDVSIVSNLLYLRRGFVRVFGGPHVSNPLPFLVYKQNPSLDRFCHFYGKFLIE